MAFVDVGTATNESQRIRMPVLPEISPRPHNGAPPLPARPSASTHNLLGPTTPSLGSIPSSTAGSSSSLPGSIDSSRASDRQPPVPVRRAPLPPISPAPNTSSPASVRRAPAGSSNGTIFCIYDCCLKVLMILTCFLNYIEIGCLYSSITCLIGQSRMYLYIVKCVS